MYIVNFKNAGLYFRNGACCINRVSIPDPRTYSNVITDMQVKIGEKDGVAVIKGMQKTITIIEGKDFLGKKRNDNFIGYCENNGMEKKEAVDLLSKTAEKSFLGIKHLHLEGGRYFTGKEEKVEIYTNNYFIQNE